MFVRYFMSREVEFAEPDDPTRSVLRRMKDLKIRRMPIVSADRVVGIVSERYLHAKTRGAAGIADVEQIEASLVAPVRTWMTPNVISVDPNEHIETAARLMFDHRIGGLPVVHANKLVGIITESDIFRGLWEILSVRAERRIYFEETPTSAGEATKYDELCRRHGAQLTALLHHRAKNGDTSGMIGVRDGNVDALVDDLWRTGARVVAVETSAPEAPGGTTLA